MAILQRTDIVPKINGIVCGDNWLSFTESPNAQTKTRKFINQKSETSTITRYSTQWDFEVLLDTSDTAIKAIYDIATQHKTGADAYIQLEILDGTTATSGRKYNATVQVSSIDDDDDMVMKGTIYADGDAVESFETAAAVETETTNESTST